MVRDYGQRNDYLAHWNCPDIMVDWDKIEEVIVRGSEDPQCPICLYAPVAGKMTKCGHIYCWPCILHYLAVCEKERRNCPICFDPIQAKDLRSAVSWPFHEYNANETVDLQLMCRKKGSMRVMKVGIEEVDAVKEFPHLFDIRERQVVHSKLILASENEVRSIIDRERCELKREIDEAKGYVCPEIMFMEQAMDLLMQREAASLTGMDQLPDELSKLNLLVGGAQESCATQLTTTCLAPDDYYYFYQAVDGQHLYLHTINIRMLQSEFGALANCPRLVTGRIVEKQNFPMTEEDRKRVKYLQHLPLTCSFTVVELQFDGELIGRRVREEFVEEVNQRKKNRQKKAREDRKHDKHVNRWRDQQMGKFMAEQVDIQLESTDAFPFVSCDGSGIFHWSYALNVFYIPCPVLMYCMTVFGCSVALWLKIR